eukprot:TRINITY_DN6531_c1_g3_i1.p1 TRINITY_DN6531_c1_g3~~TRINITY_DN6531_c1_g3_i1.p1  ORF type:complete len:170 (+),score=34.86 TRINITY_DN6531_c1_g3_i1:94-603(+)
MAISQAADASCGEDPGASQQKRWRRRERNAIAETSEVHDPDVATKQDLQLQHSTADSQGGRREDEGQSDFVELPQDASVTTKVGSRQKHQPPEPCPICLEGFNPSDGMPRTCRKCNNSFHQACLSEWAKNEQQLKWEQKPWMMPSQFESGSCPCCRSSKGHDKSRRWKK